MAENYEIKIVMEAVSRVAPVMKSIAVESEKMASRIKAADTTVRDLDKHMGQLDRGVAKAATTLRSLNPTLEALDRKSKKFSTTLTSVNRNMGVLERNSAKAGGALGALAGVIEGLEQKLSQLDRKMLEMNARNVSPAVDLQTAKFDIELARVEAKVDKLGAKKAQVKVEVEEGSITRFDRQLNEFIERQSFRTKGLTTRLRDIGVTAAIAFSEPLLSGMTALASSLVAVGLAAGQAALGLGGLATVGIAQTLPAVGILAAALSRLAGVFKAVQAAQNARDQGGKQSGAADITAAARADALKNAHESLATAMRQQILAQEALNEARREGTRTLTDMLLAEQRAELAARKSRFALAAAVGSGSSGDIESLQLQSRSDTIAANRQRLDTRRAQAGGVSGLDSVQAAARGVDDATRAVDRARRAVAQAERQFNQAAGSTGAAADALALALSKLTGAERRLYRSVTNFRALFQKGGAANAVTDPLVNAFASALDRITRMFKDRKILGAATGLSEEMAKAFDKFAKFMTTGKMRDAFAFFADESAKNIGKIEDALESLVSIFFDIARAASGTFSKALDGTGNFLDRIEKFTSSQRGQNSLKKFFEDAFKQIRSFLNLGGSLIKFFAALAGAGGAEEGRKGVDGLADSIDNLTERINNNQEDVRKFFQDAIKATGDIFKVLLALGEMLIRTFDPESVDKFGKFLTDTLIPVLETAIELLGDISKLLLPLFNNPIFTNLAKLAITFGLISRTGHAIIGLGGAMLRAFTGPLGLVERILENLKKIPGAQRVINRTGLGGIGGTGTGGGVPPVITLPNGQTVIRNSPAHRQAEADAKKSARNRKLGLAGLVATAAGSQAIASNQGRSLSDASRQGSLSIANDSVRNTLNSALSFDIGGTLKNLGGFVPGGLVQRLGGRSREDFQLFAQTADASLNKLISDRNVKGLKELSDTAKKFAKDFPDYAEALGQFADKVDENIKPLEVIKDKVKELDALSARGITFDVKTQVTVPKEDLQAIENAFKRMEDSATDSIRSLRTNVRLNSRLIKNTLGSDSLEAKEALSANFGAAISNLKNAMKAGTVSVKEGMAEIRRLTRENLAMYGITGQKATNYLRSPTGDVSGKSGSPLQGGASGGWFGNRGERGQDEPVFGLAKGEAILNWAHQPPVDYALQNTFGFGLDGLFKNTRAMHSGVGSATANRYAEGGYVQGAVPAGGAAAAALARKMFALGFNVTSAKRNTSTHHGGVGNALDFGDSANDLRRVWATLFPLRAQFAELFGPAGFAGLYHGTQKFENARLQSDHEDHVHVAILSRLVGALNSVAGAAAPTIKRVRAGLGNNALGRIVQRGLDSVRGAANERLASAAPASAATYADDSGKGAQSGDARARKIWNFMIGKGFSQPQAAGWVGNLFQESGWNSAAVQQGGPGRGLAQWGDSRLAALYAYAKSRQKSWTDFNLQLDFIWRELMGPERAAYSKIKRARTIDDATNAIGLHYERFGVQGNRSGPAHQAYRDFAKASGGFIGKPVIWGGAQAKGGNYLVNSPTLFLAGEAGREIASFSGGGYNDRPHVIGSSVQPGSQSKGGRTTAQIADLLYIAALQAGDFDEAVGSAQSFIRSLRLLKTNIKGNLGKITRRLAEAASESGLIPALLTRIDSASDRRRARGLDEGATLQAEGESLRSAFGKSSQLLELAKQSLKKAEKRDDKKAAELAQASINSLESQRTDLYEKIAANAQATVNNIKSVYEAIGENITRSGRNNETTGTSDAGIVSALLANTRAEIAALTGQLNTKAVQGNPALQKSIQDDITALQDSLVSTVKNGVYNRVSTAVQRQQKQDDALGKNTTTLLDATIESTRQGIEQLRAQLASESNPDLVLALTEKIGELETDLVGMVSDRLSKTIEAVNKAYEKDLNANTVRETFANLGITRDQALSGAFSIAGLGRTDFAAVGTAKQERGQILRSQRQSAVGLLNDAIRIGDQKAIENLAKQIEDLNIAIIENVQAIRDNTDAAFNFEVQKNQEQNSFLLTLNQGAQGIANGLQAISGITDKATNLALLNQRQSELQQTSADDRSSLGRLLGLFGLDTSALGSVSGNSIVPYLQSLYTQALATGKLDDAQIDAMKGLINAIIASETALLENTKAIKDLGGSLTQTFSSTAWQTFRQAIFNGNGGLLPQYSIPSMDTGGYVAKSGLFNLHIGEKVLRRDEVENPGWNGDMEINVTKQLEVVDPSDIGRRVAWEIRGSGRR